MGVRGMIYCSCGGQKTCFKCDGKGWIDDPKIEGEENVNLPPVLKMYSTIPKSSQEKVDFGRRKPLVAQVKQEGLSVPRSAANIEAARVKMRKAAKAAKRAKALEQRNEPEQTTAKPLANAKVSRTNSEVCGRPVLSFLTDKQSIELAEHESKLAILIELLSSTGDLTEKIRLLIDGEKRAIRKLHLKARKIGNRQKTKDQI